MPEYTVVGLLDGDTLMVASVLLGRCAAVDMEHESDGFQRYGTFVEADNPAHAESVARLKAREGD